MRRNSEAPRSPAGRARPHRPGRWRPGLQEPERRDVASSEMPHGRDEATLAQGARGMKRRPAALPDSEAASTDPVAGFVALDLHVELLDLGAVVANGADPVAIGELAAK